jgi:hypothetical protein
MELIVADNICPRANLSSLTDIFGEHGYLDSIILAQQI